MLLSDIVVFQVSFSSSSTVSQNHFAFPQEMPNKKENKSLEFVRRGQTRRSHLLRAGTAQKSQDPQLRLRSGSLVLSRNASSGRPSDACGRRSSLGEEARPEAQWGGVAGSALERPDRPRASPSGCEGRGPAA